MTDKVIRRNSERIRVNTGIRLPKKEKKKEKTKGLDGRLR